MAFSSPIKAEGRAVVRPVSHVRGPDIWSILLTSEKVFRLWIRAKMTVVPQFEIRRE
jgi:hypothetical protein